MLNTILQYDVPGNPKPIVYWNRLVDIIKNRTDMYTERVIRGAMPVTPWARLIKVLLSKVPVQQIINMPSSSSRYATLLIDVVEKIDDFLAPNYTIKPRYNYFVSTKNSTPVQEYIVPCRSETPLIDLPLGDSIQFWKNIHPIHILYNDTFELCGDFLHMQFDYKEEPPSQMIVAIDTPALVFKYMTYCYNKYKAKQPWSMNEFIQQHLLDNLYTDIVNCWIFRMLEKWCVDGENNRNDIVMHSNIMNPGMVDQGIVDLNKYYVNMANKSYFVWDFLSTKWLINSNITAYMKFLKHEITLPLLRQNAYITFMIQFPIARLVVKSNRLIGRSINAKMNMELNRILLRFKLAGTIRACQNTYVQEKVERELDELIQLSKRDDSFPSEAAANTWEY